MLEVLDKELYVKTRKAAERVMKSITIFIEDKLKLKVNKKKRAIGRPWERRFLGFSFLYKTGRDTDKNPSRVNRKSKGKDKIYYIKE